jgi:hypothetical protein
MAVFVWDLIFAGIENGFELNPNGIGELDGALFIYTKYWSAGWSAFQLHMALVSWMEHFLFTHSIGELDGALFNCTWHWWAGWSTCSLVFQVFFRKSNGSLVERTLLVHSLYIGLFSIDKSAVDQLIFCWFAARSRRVVCFICRSPQQNTLIIDWFTSTREFMNLAHKVRKSRLKCSLIGNY